MRRRRLQVSTIIVAQRRVLVVRIARGWGDPLALFRRARLPKEARA
jgi:hypothetical protein